MMIKDDLPDWLDRELWCEFVAHRSAKRKPMSPYAEKLNIAFLEQHKKEHVDILKKTIASGWTGLFELPIVNNRFSEPQKGSIEDMLQATMKIQGAIIDVEPI